jgi:Family of unknown function (DUF5675)
MKTVRITRLISDDMGTFSKVAIEGLHLYAGELPWRSNLKKISCIPAGEYVCSITNSPRFGRVYTVRNVPNRGNILFHPMNFVGDSRHWQTHSEGCIGLGKSIVAMKNKGGKFQRAIGVSRIAIAEFMAALQGKDFILIIKDAPNV